MIELQDLTRKFGDVTAVNSLSLTVAAGDVCVLIGPSGCGKTTTLRMINRLIEPTSGKISIDGMDISRMKIERLRRSIGYAIQGVGLFPHMTAAENIAVVPRLLKWPRNRITRRVGELFELVGLDPRQTAGKYAAQLSGGEAQRVGVARALAADPPVLLMDEPFGAVDPLTRQRLQTQFQQIQNALKKTVIFVTHDLDEAIRLADKIAVMQSGRLLQYDTPEAVLTKPVNKFVHDFVGADRALKRLSRLIVADYLKPAPYITAGTSPADISSAIDKRPSIWVVDEQRNLVGWIDRNSLSSGLSIEDLIVRGDPTEISVFTSDSLHIALSRMLGLGFKSLPVLDDLHRFSGEIKLSDIEAATSDTEQK